MIKSILKIALLVLLCSGCNNNKINRPPKPDNLIPKDKMVDVIYDMLLMSGAKGINKRVIEAKGISPESFIYNKYDIDSLQFAQSNAYYSFDIDAYDALYEKVKLRLEADKKQFKTLVEAETAKKDSILKVNKARIDSLKRLGKDKNGKQIKVMRENRSKIIDSLKQLNQQQE